MRLWINILVATIALCFCLTPLRGQDISEHEERKARLEKEIALIDRQLADNSAQSRDALAQLNLIRKKISNRKALIAENDRQIKSYNTRIQSAQRQINQLQDKVDTLSDHYAKLVTVAYKNRDARVWYMYILASDDLSQAFRRYSYLRGLSSNMNEQATRIKELQAQIESEKAELTRLKSKEEELRSSRQAEVKALSSEEAQSSKVVSQLKRDRSKYQKQLNERKRQVEALDREIKRLMEAAMKPASGKKAEPIDYKLAESFSANKGKLPWPAEGPVVDAFGQHYHPVFTTLKLPFNNGIGIALAKGTEIKAVFDGVVKQIVVMPGYNQCVLVQHGNYFTFYCKLKSTSVKAGDKVKTGQTIGVVDTINGETQLHFQIWYNQKPQNPETWLR